MTINMNTINELVDQIGTRIAGMDNESMLYVITGGAIAVGISYLAKSMGNDEEKRINQWIKRNNLNNVGDSRDTIYAGGTPLFDERTGKREDRIDYIKRKHPSEPWNK